MVLLLDSGTIPAAQRDDALTALLSEASGPVRVTHDVPDELIRNRTHYWQLGPANGLFRAQDDSMRLQRSARAIQADDRELFAMTYQHRGCSVTVEGGEATIQPRGSLSLHNVSGSHEFIFRGEVDNASFTMTHEDLGLPVPQALEAAARMRSSPLHPLVCSTFVTLSGAAQQLSDFATPDGAAQGPSSSEEASSLLASATMKLIRALVLSVQPDRRAARDALEDAMLTIVTTFVLQHIHDPDLDADRIAAETRVPLEQVRSLRVDDGGTIEDFIRTQRLAGAFKELSSPQLRSQSISAIGRRWCFPDPASLVARFTREFGFAPGENAREQEDVR